MGLESYGEWASPEAESALVAGEAGGLVRADYHVAVTLLFGLCGNHGNRLPPERLGSCHTGFVNGYVIEGHVPAADIQRMLEEKPKIAGLAVPGMPQGSPGMELGGGKEAYDVIAFNRDGSTRVFAKH